MKRIARRLISFGKNLFVKPPTKEEKIRSYIANGRKPWSPGYNEYKWDSIETSVHSASILKGFSGGRLPEGFGLGIDERIVEYPWIFLNLSDSPSSLLDAGSTFNFEALLKTPLLKKKDILIYTFHPEGTNFPSKKISYAYGDLREMPFKDGQFDEVVCQSTIEHIDMDNAIYGYANDNASNKGVKSYDYLKAVEELIRVVANGGKLMLTFPYGKFENHGYFQQLDAEMVNRIVEKMQGTGEIKFTYFKYVKEGWKFCPKEECDVLECYNPHTGKGKGEDGAAHSRGICCILFNKK